MTVVPPVLCLTLKISGGHEAALKQEINAPVRCILMLDSQSPSRESSTTLIDEGETLELTSPLHPLWRELLK